MIPIVVDPSWLQAQRESVVVADVRWYLDGRSGRDAYAGREEATVRGEVLAAGQAPRARHAAPARVDRVVETEVPLAGARVDHDAADRANVAG